jgi:hypothetical protein
VKLLVLTGDNGEQRSDGAAGGRGTAVAVAERASRAARVLGDGGCGLRGKTLGHSRYL